mmetsp:Transcript_34569/g.70724  ORF Transcript_34569/g.70724 Transcript_34569/m.70724 type:complete len:285 (+) Transcript_34569:58-912(+)
MPSHRRSSRATRRCSLQCLDLVSSMQSLVLDGSSDDENQPPRRRSAKTTSKHQQKQQPRRSKRIQEQNAKKKKQQTLLSLPSSPVSTIDTPSSTITTTTTSSNHDLLADLLPKVASLSSVITPTKTPGKQLPRGVHFGNNSVAKFSGCDPPMHMERLSPNASQQLFPREDDDDDDESSVDDETKQNCHILAQWDDSFDELDQIESDDDDDFVEVDNIGQEVELWRDATVIVEEEEDIVDDNTTLPCPYDLHRVSSRPTKRVDEYFCKGCGSGVRRTTRYVYEED